MPTYIAGFEIDAVLSEDRTTECEITDHPVEKGVSITDHARVKPKKLKLECIVSDTPVGGLAERRGLTIEAENGTTLADYIASDSIREFMENLLVARKPFTVSTEWTRNGTSTAPNGSKGYKAFDNMMIESINETIDPDTGDACKFTVSLKQITFVTNNRTTVKVAVPRAGKKIIKGNKPNDTAKPPPELESHLSKFEEYVSDKLTGRGEFDGIDNFVGGFLTPGAR